MDAKKLKIFCVLISIFGLVATIFSFYQSAQSLENIFNLIAIWSYSPYLLLGLAPFFLINKSTLKITASMALIVTSTGVLFYADTFLNADAQGALIYLFLPLWQWCGIIVLYGLFFLTTFIFSKLNK